MKTTSLKLFFKTCVVLTYCGLLYSGFQNWKKEKHDFEVTDLALLEEVKQLIDAKPAGIIEWPSSSCLEFDSIHQQPHLRVMVYRKNSPECLQGWDRRVGILIAKRDDFRIYYEEWLTVSLTTGLSFPTRRYFFPLN